MTLTATAASDVFAQDIEDLPDEIRQDLAGDENAEPAAPAKPPIQPPQRKSQTAPAPAARPAAAPASSGELINEQQARRLFAIAMGAGWTKDDYRARLKSEFGIDSDKALPKSQYEDAVKFFQEAGR